MTTTSSNNPGSTLTLDDLKAAMEKLKALPPTPPAPVIMETSRLLVIAGEDWSKVRSPGRARRRRKQGHRQNIVTIWKPDPTIYKIDGKMVMHPAIAAQLRAEIAKRQNDDLEKTIANSRFSY